MDADTVLTLVSLAATLLGAALVAVGIWDRRHTATRLEQEMPDGTAAARARHEAFSASVNPGPPPGTVAIYSQAEADAYRRLAPVRSEALASAAAVLEHADQRERTLRQTLAADLRAGLWREATGAVLVVVAVVAATIAALT